MRVPYAIAPDDFAVLCKVIASTARGSGLPPDDAEEFSQWAHLKLLERNYEPLVRFSGRSSLYTYLTVVVRRLLLDWRNLQYGKWRPSAWARQRGAVAVEFDRLVTRDGHTIGEALNIVRERRRSDTALLSELEANLPARYRRQIVAYDELEGVPVAAVWTDQKEHAEHVAETRHRRRLLMSAWNDLAPADRQLLHLRFGRGLPVVRIAEMLNVRPKSLYPRIQRILDVFLRRLAARGEDATRRGRARRITPRPSRAVA